MAYRNGMHGLGITPPLFEYPVLFPNGDPLPPQQPPAGIPTTVPNPYKPLPPAPLPPGYQAEPAASSNTLLWVGLAVGAFLLLKGKR